VRQRPARRVLTRFQPLGKDFAGFSAATRSRTTSFTAICPQRCRSVLRTCIRSRFSMRRLCRRSDSRPLYAEFEDFSAGILRTAPDHPACSIEQDQRMHIAVAPREKTFPGREAHIHRLISFVRLSTKAAYVTGWCIQDTCNVILPIAPKGRFAPSQIFRAFLADLDSAASTGIMAPAQSEDISPTDGRSLRSRAFDLVSARASQWGKPALAKRLLSLRCRGGP